MPAQYTTDDGRFQVIRPLIECGEDQIADYAEMRRFPILPCNLCGSQSGLQRDAMTELLNDLQSRIPNVREVMLAALKNVRASHLLDQNVTRMDNDDALLKPEVSPESLHSGLIQVEAP